VVAVCVESTHRFAVLEAGMSVRGEIERLARIAAPDVAVITNVGLAHAEGVGGTRADVAREKGALFAHARCCVAPIDDTVNLKVLNGPARVETFGRGDGARYRLLDRNGSRIVIERPKEDAREIISLDLPLVGEAAAIDFCAALAAAEAVAHSILATAIASAMEKVTPRKGRLCIVHAGDVTIIDDTYNANPMSMRAALATLAEIGRGRRTIAVLGEMRELGPSAEDEHAQIGNIAADFGVAVMVGCGGLIGRALEQAHARGVETHAAESVVEAARAAKKIVRAGDVVLVKGSRGVATEVVVEALVS